MTRPLTAADVPALLAALTASDPGRPRVTWYGDGERVELSARVLSNWVVKTANLLGDALEVGTGTTVRLALPPHWRTLVWWLAVPSAGARVLTRDDAHPDGRDAPPGRHDDVVLVASVPPADVVVALAALARSAGPLPPGALDYNAEVGGQPDELLGLEPPAPLPQPVRTWPDGTRLLTRGEDPATLVDVLRCDGSVVLLGPGSPVGEDLDALAAQERVTERTGC